MPIDPQASEWIDVACFIAAAAVSFWFAWIWRPYKEESA